MYNIIVEYDDKLRATKRIYRGYKRRHKTKGFDPDKFISLELFHKLLYQNCRYCRNPPATAIASDRNKPRSDRTTKGFLRNSIDRIDNNAGYTEDNVCSACQFCNCAKSAMSEEDL